jgi:hypothetical protein
MCNQTTKSQWLELSPILAPVARNIIFFSLLPFVSFSTLCVKRRGAHSVISDRRTRCYLPPFFLFLSLAESNNNQSKPINGWLAIELKLSCEDDCTKQKLMQSNGERSSIKIFLYRAVTNQLKKKKKKTLNSYTIIIRWLMTRNWSGNSLSLKGHHRAS